MPASTLSTLNLICRWLPLIPTDCALPIPLTSSSPYVTSQKTKYYMGWRALNCQKDKEIMGWRARLHARLSFVSHVMSTFTLDVCGSIFICIGAVVGWGRYYAGRVIQCHAMLPRSHICIQLENSSKAPAERDPYQFETTIHHCNFSRNPLSAVNCSFQAITLVTGSEPPDNFESQPAAGCTELILVDRRVCVCSILRATSRGPCHRDT